MVSVFCNTLLSPNSTVTSIYNVNPSTQLLNGGIMEKPPITVIEYRLEFALETVKMWRQSFQRAMGLVEQENYSDLIDQLNFFSTIETSKIRVAINTNDSSIIGLLVQDGRFVEQLYVHVEYQQQGIGSRLLNEAKEVSPNCVELATFQRNIGAQSFYRKHGFVEINRGYAVHLGNPWATSKEDLADIKYRWTS